MVRKIEKLRKIQCQKEEETNKYKKNNKKNYKRN